MTLYMSVNDCMTLYSFFPHPSFCLVTKMNLLNKTLYPHLIRANSYFSVNKVDLLNNIFSTINWRQINNLVLRAVFLKKALAPHDFAGNFYLI